MSPWLDDVMFYLPGFASVPIAIGGMLGFWLVWRMIRPKKKPSAPTILPPTVPPKEGQK